MGNNGLLAEIPPEPQDTTLFIDDTGATALSAAAATAKIVMFAGVLPLGYRMLCWLQDGDWPELTLYSLGLAPPWLSWAGARELLNTIFALPVEPVAIIGCALIYAIATIVFDSGRNPDRNPTRYP